MPSPIAIDCRGLCKTFVRTPIPIRMLQDRILRPRLRRGSVKVHAVRDATLSVRKGEWVGIYGRNGSGKSTFLRMVAGLLPSDAGTVRTHGSLSSFFELGTGFSGERRADENIRLHGLLRGLSRAQIDRMTERIIDTAGVRSHLELPMKCFSSGMRMRVAFAAAMEIDADLYLFDEVLAVGDAAFRTTCREHFDRLRSAGKTVLIVCHNHDFLAKRCDRTVYFENGRLSETPPDPVAAAPDDDRIEF